MRIQGLPACIVPKDPDCNDNIVIMLLDVVPVKPLDKSHAFSPHRVDRGNVLGDCWVWRHWDDPTPTRTTGTFVKTLTLA
jgi:hypothetical protein